MKRYDIRLSNHAIERFRDRYKMKEKVPYNKDYRGFYVDKLFEILDEMNIDPNSYVEVITNVDNLKKKHQKYAENRKQEDKSLMYTHKGLQLVFLFTKNFDTLISVRIDTGKFKKRRSQHPIKLRELVDEEFVEINEVLEEQNV